MPQNPQTGNSPGQGVGKDATDQSGQDRVAASKADEDPTKQPNEDGIVFFEASISKVVKDEDGNDLVVMSDHVGPGERLLSEVQAEKAEAEASESRDGSGDAKSQAQDAAKAQERDNSKAQEKDNAKLKGGAVDPSKDNKPGQDNKPGR